MNAKIVLRTAMEMNQKKELIYIYFYTGQLDLIAIHF